MCKKCKKYLYPLYLNKRKGGKIMKNYYVNKNTQPTGGHEIHIEYCYRLPNVMNRIYLGCLENSKEAVQKAENYYYDIDGCYYCCPEIHKK